MGFNILSRSYFKTVRNHRVSPKKFHHVTLRCYGSSPQSTNLEKLILNTIKATGPIPVSTYMNLCLSHPTEGYYMNPMHHVFGVRGDFTTSSEISQVFGELIALWHIAQWSHLGCLPMIRVVELGPGRGTLMHDMLQVFARFRDCASALRSVHLVETSSSMRKLQEENLRQISNRLSLPVIWHDSMEDISEDKLASNNVHTVIVANEFFDALPVHLLEKADEDWHEIMVSISPSPETDSSGNPAQLTASPYPFRFVRASKPTFSSRVLGASSPRFAHLPNSSRLEVSPSSYKAARKLAELAGSHGSGSALIIDYGGTHAFGNSLRAFKKHKIVDIFESPGECDLTANVDFAYLKEAMAGAAKVHGPIAQSTFLEKMGMGLRVQMLTKAANSQERKEEIERSAKRLSDMTGMGREYQILGVTCHHKADASSVESDVWPFM